MTSPATRATVIDHLSSRLTGRVLAPGDPAYDEARTLFYGGMDRRPAAIARVADARDVAGAIAITREHGLALAVRSGGHSLAGHSVPDGGLMVDLGELRALELDVEGRSAWAGTGITTGAYTEAAAAHGLATGFGDTGSVGVGGLTLGGGVGFLVRKHGLTIDDLLAAELVTADGEVLHVDEGSHPDLFWAIRGGGGNFGVVTRLRLRLHELGSVVGGMLILPATPRTVAGFVAAADDAPEELSAIANVMKAPPMPFLPEEAHGRPVLFALMLHAGDAEAGERAVAPFRALAEPVADMVRPIAYPEIYEGPGGDEDFHPLFAARNLFTDRFDEELAATILDRVSAPTAMMAAVQLRVLGGAMARVPDEATAFAHRRRRIMVNVAALFEDPGDREPQAGWVDDLTDLLRDGPG
ncbi:MAG TPA: FAD-binding oxidoreductase, partial [Actinomycetota bacterium]|nr:FAD-binding oxidoreductase [Actinomycetota bacterium]